VDQVVAPQTVSIVPTLAHVLLVPDRSLFLPGRQKTQPTVSVIATIQKDLASVPTIQNVLKRLCSISRDVVRAEHHLGTG
jgi:hypothetical protein